METHKFRSHLIDISATKEALVGAGACNPATACGEQSNQAAEQVFGGEGSRQ